MAKTKKSLPDGVSQNAAGFGLSIAELLGKQPAKKQQNAQTDSTKSAKKENKENKITRWSLQRQTAGRGGKVVTLVVFPKDSNTDLELLARQMRKALGCGSHVEENKIVLQGDISDRAALWLEKQNGVPK